MCKRCTVFTLKFCFIVLFDYRIGEWADFFSNIKLPIFGIKDVHFALKGLVQQKYSMFKQQFYLPFYNKAIYYQILSIVHDYIKSVKMANKQ